MHKKSLVVSSIIIGLTCLSGYFFYNKLHTNSPDDIKDYTGKYILNPDYKEFHKYEWTDLKSVYPTKLAYDPAWFILPPDKYIPKEQPIPRNISSISDPIIRRQAYFNFLCRNEYAAYMTSDIKNIDLYNPPSEGLLDLRLYKNIIKIKDYNIIDDKNFKVASDANSNPFILPIYNSGYEPLNSEFTYDFFYQKSPLNTNKNYNANDNRFKEIMDYSGKIYQIKFDKFSGQFLPLRQMLHSQSRYYIIEKYIERNSLINLGIAGHETIIYDRKEKKIVFYIKQFNMGAFLPWRNENVISNFSWAKSNGCDFKPTYIDNF